MPSNGSASNSSNESGATSTGESVQDSGVDSGVVVKLLEVMNGEMKRTEMQEKLGLKHEDSFRKTYLKPALSEGYIESTTPEKPTSKQQKYRMTNKGGALLRAVAGKDTKQETMYDSGVDGGEDSGVVVKLLEVVNGEMKRTEMQEKLGLKHEDSFRARYLNPALDAGYIEPTIPDKPTSKQQKYRMTDKGRKLMRGRS